MPKTTLGGMEIEIDDEGFIQDPEKWNKAVAEDLARIENAYPMNDDHWKLVNYIRNYFLEQGNAPPVRLLCIKTGFKLKEVYKLFPNGPAEGACKVAGLAKPAGCI